MSVGSEAGDWATSSLGSESPSKSRPVVGSYQLGKVIGKGSFGKVRIGKHVTTNQTVAVKILEKSKLTQRGDSERIAREIRVLQLLRHDNICNLYEVIETSKELYLVMEYASGGELFDHIVHHGHLKEPEARRLFGQTVAAVHYCHANGVIHRDLKPENLLLDDARNIKLIDYGFANVVQPNELMRTFCGSPAYAPPEMISGHSYIGVSVDIWSLGVILFALLAGYLPFDDDSVTELYRKILIGKFKCPKHVSEEAKDLIKKILVAEPQDRLPLHEVVQHPWMTDNGRLAPVVLVASNEALVDEPEAAVVQEMVALGFEEDTVRADLASSVRNQATATYFLLLTRRRKESNSSDGGPPSGLAADSASSPTRYKPKFSSPLAAAALAPHAVSASPAVGGPAVGGTAAGAAASAHAASARTPATTTLTTVVGLVEPPARARSGSLPPIELDSLAMLSRRTAEATASLNNSNGSNASLNSSNGSNHNGLIGRKRSPRDEFYTPPASVDAAGADASGAIEIGGRRSSLFGSSPMSTPTQSPATHESVIAATGGFSGSARRHTTASLAPPLAGAATGSSAPTSSSSAAAAALAARAAAKSSKPRTSDPSSAPSTPLRGGPTSGRRASQSIGPTEGGVVMNMNRSQEMQASSLTGPDGIHDFTQSSPTGLNNSSPAGSLSFTRVSTGRKGSVFDATSAGLAGAPAASASHEDDGLRTVKGVFSVSTTSSKEPSEMVAEIERVLTASNIVFKRAAFRFECQTPDGTVERDMVRFELEVCKIPKIALRGLRLKRIIGDTWVYKRLCHSLVSQMVL